MWGQSTWGYPAWDQPRVAVGGGFAGVAGMFSYGDFQHGAYRTAMFRPPILHRRPEAW